MLWHDLTFPEIQECAQKGFVVVVPFGTTEQHGRHLTTDTDTHLVTEVAKRVSEVTEGILVTPTVWVGLSQMHRGLPGNLMVSLETFTAFVTDICASIREQGFLKAVLLNGHGGNQGILQALALALSDKLGMRVLTLSYWNVLADEISSIRKSPTGGMRHACEFETSLELFLRPDRVRKDAIADYRPNSPILSFIRRDMFSPGKAYLPEFYSQTPGGVLGEPSMASADTGEKLLSLVVEKLREMILEFRALDWKRQAGAS